MKRAKARSAIDAANIDAANYRLFEDALALCHGNVSLLADRLRLGGGEAYPATTVYGWRQRGRVPPYHADALRKVLRAPRKRQRSRAAEVCA